MNPKEAKYKKFALVQEMFETIQVVKNFDATVTKNVAHDINSKGRLLLAGEGSSRLFPAKNLTRQARRSGLEVCIITDGSHQSAQYDLDKYAVFCASNSGRTKEVVMLAKKLADTGHKHCYGLTANENTLLAQACSETFVLNCGKESAVAATKSVVEQALFYHSILWHLNGDSEVPNLSELAAAIEQALTMSIDASLIKKATQAPIIYFAGYNDGIAEELTIKTNEITRKKSDFLEGTYAVHGIEEVMQANEIVFVIDPIEEEIEKFQQVLVDGIGLQVVAIADRDTVFPTIRVPNVGDMTPFVYLCAGWNVLVEIGLALDISLDKPERARKVGNEFGGN